MKHRAFIWRLVVFSTLITLPVPADGQGKTNLPVEDPLLGTWHLNVSRSTYKPGPPPKSQTRIYEVHPIRNTGHGKDRPRRRTLDNGAIGVRLRQAGTPCHRI